MGWIRPTIIIVVTLCGLWALYWYALAFGVKETIARQMVQSGSAFKISSPYQPDIDGFPGAMVLTWPQVHLETSNAIVDVGALEIRLWPFPAAPATIYAASGITINRPQVQQVVDLDSFSLEIRLPFSAWAVTIKSASLARGASLLEAAGDVILPFDAQAPIAGTMNARVTGYGDLIDYLVSQDMFAEEDAGLAKGFLNAMAATQGTPGSLSVPLNIKDSWLYVGPVRAFNLRPAPVVTPVPAPAPESGLPQPQNHPAYSGSISPLDLNPQIGP